MNMKPWIISGLCCLGAGVILTVAGLAAGAMDASRWAKKLDLTTIDYQPDETFHAVVLDADYANVTIRKGSTASVTAKNAERDKFSAEVRNGVLYIEQDYKQQHWIVFNISNINMYTVDITVTLPDEEYSSLSVNAACGEVTISGMQSKRVDISADCGKVSMEKMQTRSAGISCALGDLDMKDCEAAGTLFVNMNCGTAELKNIEVGDLFTMDNDLGDAELSNMTVGRSTITLNCGSLEMNDYTETLQNEKSSMEIDMGDCDIEDSTLYCLTAELNCGSFDAQNTQLLNRTAIAADVGDIDLNLRGKKSDYVILSKFSDAPDGANAICADTNVGDVDISFTGS